MSRSSSVLLRSWVAAAVVGCAGAFLPPRTASRGPLTVFSGSSPGGRDGSLAARVTAFSVLKEFKSQATGDLVERQGRHLNERDLAFAKRLVSETQRRCGEIDAIIDGSCENRPKGATLVALRLGVAQLLYLDSVPARAAVHSSVELCKKFHGASGSGRRDCIFQEAFQTQRGATPLEWDIKLISRL